MSKINTNILNEEMFNGIRDSIKDNLPKLDHSPEYIEKILESIKAVDSNIAENFKEQNLKMLSRFNFDNFLESSKKVVREITKNMMISEIIPEIQIVHPDSSINVFNKVDFREFTFESERALFGRLIESFETLDSIREFLDNEGIKYNINDSKDSIEIEEYEIRVYSSLGKIDAVLF